MKKGFKLSEIPKFLTGEHNVVRTKNSLSSYDVFYSYGTNTNAAYAHSGIYRTQWHPPHTSIYLSMEWFSSSYRNVSICCVVV